MGLAARDILKAGAPIELATVTLVPVIRMRVSVVPLRDRMMANATSTLSALVVRESAGDRVLDWEGDGRTLDALREEAAGLAQVLDG